MRSSSVKPLSSSDAVAVALLRDVGMVTAAGPVPSTKVATSAVVPSGQMDRVFVIDGDTARLRLVRTGQRRDGLVEILAGLDPGETVATGNNRLLESGRRVRVQP